MSLVHDLFLGEPDMHMLVPFGTHDLIDDFQP